MSSELFALGVLDGMDKAAAASGKSAAGMGIPADQSGKDTPTMTAKSKGGSANSNAKRGPFNKTHQAGMAPNGTLSGENKNV